MCKMSKCKWLLLQCKEFPFWVFTEQKHKNRSLELCLIHFLLIMPKDFKSVQHLAGEAGSVPSLSLSQSFPYSSSNTSVSLPQEWVGCSRTEPKWELQFRQYEWLGAEGAKQSWLCNPMLSSAVLNPPGGDFFSCVH